MTEQILNKELLERDIKKAIIDSFIKGRDEIVRDSKYIINNSDGFKDKLILSHIIDTYLNDGNVDIKVFYYQLLDTCTNDKNREKLDQIRKIYLTNTSLLESINDGTYSEIGILSEKDLMDIRNAYLDIITTIQEMIKILRTNFAD